MRPKDGKLSKEPPQLRLINWDPGGEFRFLRLNSQSLLEVWKEPMLLKGQSETVIVRKDATGYFEVQGCKRF